MHQIDNTGKPLAQQLSDYLAGFVTPNRLSRFHETLNFRTRHLTIVLEDIFQPHNASAILRTCDCFGIQDVHIIENRNTYKVNPDVALGASKWLTINKYNSSEENTSSCLHELKSRGYRIVATTPHLNDHTPETLPLDQKTALVFGTELEGLSREALDLADDFLRIPMVGLTESLNISVSAAIILYTLAARLRSGQVQWTLTPEDNHEVLLEWLKNSIRNSDLIISEFLKRSL